MEVFGHKAGEQEIKVICEMRRWENNENNVDKTQLCSESDEASSEEEKIEKSWSN